jgi:hypothetical protein
VPTIDKIADRVPQDSSERRIEIGKRRIGQPIASTDIKGIDRGHKVGGLTESHLNEGS